MRLQYNLNTLPSKLLYIGYFRIDTPDYIHLFEVFEKPDKASVYREKINYHAANFSADECVVIIDSNDNHFMTTPGFKNC